MEKRYHGVFSVHVQIVLWILIFLLTSVTFASNLNYTKVYNRLKVCLQNSPLRGTQSHYGPPNDAKAHYTELLLRTAKFRNISIHAAAGYDGPWIENLFIHRFITKPLDYFTGMIPLFIQWTDIHVHEFRTHENSTIDRHYKRLYQSIITDLKNMLRPDVIYVTVCQDDEGLTDTIPQLFPNILTMSAGGYGHIPIPLVKGTLAYVEPPLAFENQIAFFGYSNRIPRFYMLGELERLIKPLGPLVKFKYGQSSHWQRDIAATQFNLAPRGFGRTSYRLAEIVQLGRIPVLLYDDVPWLPYEGTAISFNSFGLVGRLGMLHLLLDKMVNMTNKEVTQRLNIVRSVRDHYTYEGVLNQISFFFRDPLGPRGGHLRCIRVPDDPVGMGAQGFSVKAGAAGASAGGSSRSSRSGGRSTNRERDKDKSH